MARFFSFSLLPLITVSNVCGPRTMAVLAANGQLGKGDSFITPIRVRDRIDSTAVAKDASRQNGATKRIIGKFIARRRRPRHRLCVQGYWSLKQ